MRVALASCGGLSGIWLDVSRHATCGLAVSVNLRIALSPAVDEPILNNDVMHQGGFCMVDSARWILYGGSVRGLGHATHLGRAKLGRRSLGMRSAF